MTTLARGTVPFPDVGDAVAIDRLATELATSSSALNRTTEPLAPATAAARAVWDGRAATGFEEQVSVETGRLATVIGVVDRAVPVLRTYAGAVATTRSLYADAVGRERQAAAAGEWGTAARAAAIADEQACVTAIGRATSACVAALAALEGALAASRSAGVGRGVSTTTPVDGAPGAPVAGRADGVPGVPDTTPLTDQDWRTAAERLGVEEAAIRAVAEVETTSAPFLADGRPKILYEPHYFHRLTGGRHARTHPHLSAPYDRNRRYGTFTRQYVLLDEAIRLDRSAALQSASWGRFQVMGANYATAGYESVEALVADARAGEAGQLRIFVNHIESNETMHQALRDRDWRTFATLYNGSDGVRRGYHTRMQDAYTRFARPPGG